MDSVAIEPYLCRQRRSTGLAAWKPVALGAAWLAVSSCASRPSQTPSPGGDVQGTAESLPSPPGGARSFRVDAERTQLTFLVRRGGALSRLGHNHAIRSDAESGNAWVAADGRSCALQLHLPVRSFVVDDPAARAAAGPDFHGTIPDDARAGTFGNMTGASLLDAGHFPEVLVRYAGEVPGPGPAPVRVVVTVKGEPHALDVPMVVDADDDEVIASGEARMTHGEIGLQPFSIMGGAIAVADEITVRFELVASRAADGH
jgi:hypothetical protein